MATKLLLINDVESLGRSGDVVSVKPGFARNFLIPNKLAIVADKHALRLQDRLKEERQKKAAVDRQEADQTAKVLEPLVLMKIVKVDHDGHMYGSVTAHDIAVLIEEKSGVALEKRNILVKQPIKATGVHTINIRLKEDVALSIKLKILTEEEAAKAETEA